MQTKLSQVGWVIQTKDGNQRYEVVAPLGSGGMANVYHGKDHLNGTEVAIKFPHKELYPNDEALKRFEREMAVTLSLDHPDIIRGLDVGYDVVKEEIFYVMELFEGKDISRRIDDLNNARAGRRIVGSLIPLAHIRHIGDRLLRALEAVHGMGLVHRDIKPQNVLISDEDGGALRVKLSDFGIAKALTTCNIDSVRGGTQLTQVRAVIGTPGYFSPEQATSDPEVDQRSDLYAVGALVYELVTGQPSIVYRNPFKTFVLELLQPFAEEKYPSELVEEMDPELEQWILRLLEREPKDRFQTASEARQAFLEIFEPENRESRLGSGVRLTAQTSLPAKVIAGEKKSSQLPLLVAAVGFVIAVVASFLMRSQKPEEKANAVQGTSSHSGTEAPQESTASADTAPKIARVKVEDLPEKDQAAYRAAVRFLSIPYFKKSRCPASVKIGLWSLVDRHPRFADPYFRIAECFDREKKPEEAAKYRALFKSVSGGLEEPQ